MICSIWKTAKVLLVTDSTSVCDGLCEQVVKFNSEDELRRHYGKYLRHKREKRKDARIIEVQIKKMTDPLLRESPQ